MVTGVITPEHYPDNEVPISVMAQDLLQTYKYGWKTSYYQNTYDMKSDDGIDDKKEAFRKSIKYRRGGRL